MVSVLPQEIGSRRAVSGELGKQLLDVITSGMYSDPRMAIREYIQNSADSIDLGKKRGLYVTERPRIEVTLDGRKRSITVTDNGIGLDGADVDGRLGSLGCSTKIASEQRGFRGIGRLGGLAYCDVLRFETRRSSREPVHVVEWNGQALRKQVSLIGKHEPLADAVRRIAFVGSRRAKRKDDPARFFRVQMVNVHRFHSDALMNVRGLREYLSQTAPLAFDLAVFPFAVQIKQHLAEVSGYRSYDVVLNGAPIARPYREAFNAREGSEDRVNDIELVECVDSRGQLLCRGWYAMTGFLSALPQHVTMRGIRVRQGNIAVADEYFLKDLFSENRFATWHIGELHVTSRLKLNARRDGFEESPEYEYFLEWASLLCRRLGGLCRKSSKDRSAHHSIKSLISDVERQLAIPFFLDEDHARLYVEGAEQKLLRLRRLLSNATGDKQRLADSLSARLTKLRDSHVYLRNVLDGRVLRGKDNRQMIVDLCNRMLSVNQGHVAWEHLLEVVRPYMKGQKNSCAAGKSCVNTTL